MNLISLVNEPQTEQEMLSNYKRLAIEMSFVYESKQLLYVMVKPTTDYATVVDYSKIDNNVTIGLTPQSVQIKDFTSDILDTMCQTYHIRNCFSVDTREMPRSLTTKISLMNNINIAEDESFSFETDDQIFAFEHNIILNSYEILGMCVDNSVLDHIYTGTYDGAYFVPDFDKNHDLFQKYDNYHVNLYYRRSAHGDFIYLGKIHEIMTAPSIYPNRGQSKLGDTNLVDIDLIYHKFSTREKWNIYSTSYYDEFISFSLD